MLTLREVPWVARVENLVKFDEAKALMLVEGDEQEDELPLPDNVIEHLLAIDSDVEDAWDLKDIGRYGWIYVWSSFSAVLEIVTRGFSLHVIAFVNRGSSSLDLRL